MRRWVEQSWYAEQPDWRVSALKPLLMAGSALFAAAASSRRWLYDQKFLPAEEVLGLRIISVGNLNVGGTGKTPATIFLAERLKSMGHRVVVLSRGYGRVSRDDVHVNPAKTLPTVTEAGDEPLLIARRAKVDLLVGTDRVRLAHRAKDELGATIALLDDGFQHRRLSRALDVVVVDGNVGFGNGHHLPAGPLRESPVALSRAGLIWLTGSESPKTLERFTTAPIVRVQSRAGWLENSEGGRESLEKLRGQSVVALSGIARPERFAKTLEQLGASVSSVFAFPDHHLFSDTDVQSALTAARLQNAIVVTTEKDAVRLPPSSTIAVLALETVVVEGENHLSDALSAAIDTRQPRSP